MTKPTRYFLIGAIVVALAALVSVTAEESPHSLH